MTIEAGDYLRVHTHDPLRFLNPEIKVGSCCEVETIARAAGSAPVAVLLFTGITEYNQDTGNASLCREYLAVERGLEKWLEAA